MTPLPSRRAADSPSGSTLIEMMVVLAIVALLFALAIPALSVLGAGPRSSGPTDSLRLVAVRTGLIARGSATTRDTVRVIIALPDGRILAGGPDAP